MDDYDSGYDNGYDDAIGRCVNDINDIFHTNFNYWYEAEDFLRNNACAQFPGKVE